MTAPLSFRPGDQLASSVCTTRVVVTAAAPAGSSPWRRFRRSPELIGTFAVLLTENLNQDAPLHQRFLDRCYRDSVNIIASAIRRGQSSGDYRTDIDPAIKVAEIVAFLTGMETSWLLDPSVPLIDVFREYTNSPARQLTSKPPSNET
jgi:hypothetical protein